MAQTYNDEIYSQATVVDTTMSRVENNFAAQKSSFSGTSNPSDAVAGMLHMRTGGTGDGLRIRNADDDAWHKILTGTASLKLWMYRNDTDEGWTIDATVTDRVLALKGGSGSYNANGGTNAGSWTVTGFSGTAANDTHNHQWYNYTTLTASDQTYNASGTAVTVPAGGGKAAAGCATISRSVVTTANAADTLADSYTAGDTHNHTVTVTNNGAYRPAAAIGTLQYPDLA